MADDAQHARVMERGHPVLRTLDGVMCHEAPFRLATECRGEAFDHAIRRVTRFAFVLSAIVGAIVLSGAVPPLMGAIAASWLVGALLARAVAAGRAREHGRALVDFEAGTVSFWPRRGPPRAAPLAESKLRLVRATDALLPVWIWLAPAGARAFRLGKATEEDADRIAALFRGYHVAIERDGV